MKTPWWTPWWTPIALLPIALPALAEPSCERRSGATVPVVVELYTSEGCSSCPPADRWLSTLKDRADVLPIAFHVDYWDRLGWPDRFATPQITKRQYELANLRGSSSVYTPQVVANGQDWRRWPALPKPADAPPITLTLSRDGANVTASIDGPGTAARLAGYWVVLEDRHVSRVSAGENRGETLRHDHVVRHYQPVSPWTGPKRWSLPVLPGVAEHPRQVAFVVTDALGQRPLQALALDC
jgi:hypothetical protein